MDLNNKLLSYELKQHIKNCNCIIDDIPIIIKADTTTEIIKETQPNICENLSDILDSKIYYYKRREIRFSDYQENCKIFW